MVGAANVITATQEKSNTRSVNDPFCIEWVMCLRSKMACPILLGLEPLFFSRYVVLQRKKRALLKGIRLWKPFKPQRNHRCVNVCTWGSQRLEQNRLSPKWCEAMMGGGREVTCKKKKSIQYKT